MAFAESQLPGALRNSFVVAVATAIITTLVALPAAYAIARYRSAVRNATIGWILISQVFPFILIVIPVFIVLQADRPHQHAAGSRHRLRRLGAALHPVDAPGLRGRDPA